VCDAAPQVAGSVVLRSYVEVRRSLPHLGPLT
jgi:hypothetical protein